jgi:hypothetical protein
MGVNGRLGVVAAAIAAALGIWSAAELIGIGLRSPVFDASGQWFRITPPLVAVTAAVPALAGWGLLALLERITANAARIWTGLAAVALLGSLSMPLSGGGVSEAVRTVLVLEHIVVGAILIVGLPRARQATAVTAVRRAAEKRAA